MFESEPPRQRRSESRRYTAVMVTLIIVLIGPAYQQTMQLIDRSSQAPPGRMVSVDGVATHIYCTGTGSPTVVLQAGAVGFAQSWAWVQEELSKFTRTCSYDRPGLGWSGESEIHYTGSRIAHHLHRLLYKINEPPPYVIVGHSWGGALVQIYAGLYPDDVAGIGLVDPSHPDLVNRYPETARAELERFSSMIGVASILAYAGITRATGLFAHKASGLPARAYQAAKLFVSSPQHLAAAHRELAHWGITMASAREYMYLTDVPLMVLSATQSAGELPERYMKPMQRLHAELAATSTNSLHLKIPGADHFTLLTQQEQAKMTAFALAVLIGRARAEMPIYHWHGDESEDRVLAQRLLVEGAPIRCPS